LRRKYGYWRRANRRTSHMLKLIAFVLVATGLGLAIFAGPASAAAAYTAEQQAACQNDAYRLCERAIPDEARTRACMFANINRVSPGCRRLMQSRQPSGRR
jgi:hypothetical protein